MQNSFITLALILTACFFLTHSNHAQITKFDKKTIFKLAQQDFSKHFELTESLPLDSNDLVEARIKSGLEKNITNSKDAESEIHAAVNPLDSNNMIVATMQYSNNNSGSILGQQVLKILIYSTKDGGKTWKTSSYNPLELPLLSILYGGGDPVITFDQNGKAYISFLLVEFAIFELKFTAKLGYASSTNGGETWTPKDIIDKVNFLSFTDNNRKIVDKEWIAVDRSNTVNRNNLYCAFTEVNIADTTYNVFVKRKPSQQDTFAQARIPITKGAFAFAQFVTLDVDQKGVVHLLFAGAKPEDEILSLFYCSSTNGGRSFSNPVKINEVEVPCFPPIAGVNCEVPGFASERIYACPSITIDKSNSSSSGNIYITWSGLDIYQQNKNSGMDVFVIRSIDGGKTWSKPAKLNKDKGIGVEQFYPSACVNSKGILTISWYDRREDLNNQIGRYYMASSCDGGATFSNETAVSMQAMDFTAAGKLNNGFGVGEYSQIVATNSNVFPFWADGRSNDGNLEVMMSQIPLICNRSVAVREIRNLSNDLTLHRVFPNPAAEEINLEIEFSSTGLLSVDCFGMDGRMVLQKQLEIQSGRKQIPLNIQSFSPGSYWLDLRFKRSRVRTLIVKK
jgi:hypothetical protein